MANIGDLINIQNGKLHENFRGHIMLEGFEYLGKIPHRHNSCSSLAEQDLCKTFTRTEKLKQ